MLNFTRIQFYWFSGTGNTLLVAKKMTEVFRREGLEVELRQMSFETPSGLALGSFSPEPGTALGLAFPVAEQGTYPFVWDFIRNLPPGQETPVFMTDSMLAYSGGIVGPVRKILTDKGYRPIGAREFMMPNNLFPGKINRERNEIRIQRSLEQAETFALKLLEGKARWGRIPVLSDGMGSFSQVEGTWRFMRRGYVLKVDKEKCTGCGLCGRLCPVGNITGEGIPEFGDHCYICVRCISFCPAGAIYAPRAHFKQRSPEAKNYRAVAAGELLKE